MLSEHWHLLSVEPLACWVTMDHSICLSACCPKHAGRARDSEGLSFHAGSCEAADETTSDRPSVPWGQRPNGLSPIFTMLPSTGSAQHTVGMQQAFLQLRSLPRCEGLVPQQWLCTIWMDLHLLSWVNPHFQEWQTRLNSTSIFKHNSLDRMHAKCRTYFKPIPLITF